MRAIVVSEGGEREPFCPVSLEVINEHAKIFFNLLVDPFCLSISLRVVGCREVAFNLEEVIEVLHEFRHEHCSSIRNHNLGYSMFGVYFIM